MSFLSSYRHVLILPFLAVLPSACAVDAGDDTAGSSAKEREDITVRLQRESRTPVEVLKHTGRESARVASGMFPVAALGLRATALAEDKARTFLERHGEVFGPRDVQSELALRADETDELGMHHVSFGQVYEGIEVYNSPVKVHFSADGAHVSYISSDFVPGVRLSTTTPRIHEDRAVAAARGAMRSGELLAPPTLVIYAGSGGEVVSPRLAWVVDLARAETFGGVRYFVDAESASVLDETSLSRSLVARPPTDDAPTSQRQVHPGAGQVGVQEAAQQAAQPNVPAFFFSMTQKTHDAGGGAGLPGEPKCDRRGCMGGTDQETVNLNRNVTIAMDTIYRDFRRVSYNHGWFGGATVISTANYRPPNGDVDAFWDPRTKRFVFSKGLATLDVVGHEYAHAVTQYSANLNYRGESGALNESFSDIFGSYINSQNRNQDIWKLGVGLPGDMLAPCGALRDISNPVSCATPGNPSPGTTANWENTCREYEGVHINSGIVSRAYFNVADSIGRVKAAKIFYRALTYYLSSNSKLEDARRAAISSAYDLHCTADINGFVSCGREFGPVNAGFAAVGLDGRWVKPALNCPAQARQAGVAGMVPNLAEYKGCYTDSQNRSLPTVLAWSGATVESCTNAAQKAGYPYAGLQYGGQCFAGYSLGASKASDTECSTACSANTGEMCGGTWRNSIWYVPSASACTHDPLTEGAALKAGCSSCVTSVCSSDSSCCTNSWNAKCVAAARTNSSCR